MQKKNRSMVFEWENRRSKTNKYPPVNQHGNGISMKIPISCRKYIFQWSIFHCYVSLPGGKHPTKLHFFQKDDWCDLSRWPTKTCHIQVQWWITEAENHDFQKCIDISSSFLLQSKVSPILSLENVFCGGSWLGFPTRKSSTVSHTIRGTGIFAYMNGCFLW